MKKANFPYTGFWTSWFFEDPTAIEYEQYLIDRIASPQICEDIKQVLLILKKYELLIPTYVQDHPRGKFEIKANNVEDFMAELAVLIKQQKIDTEIDIGGYGVVYDENNEPLIQDDLVMIMGIRFFQRKFNLSTLKGIWVPIAIDKTYKFDWQIQLAKNNCPRLESSLREIKTALGIEMSPGEDEIDRDNPIWIKGYRPYLNPSILMREYQDNPPSEPFDLEEFLIKSTSK